MKAILLFSFLAFLSIDLPKEVNSTCRSNASFAHNDDSTLRACYNTTFFKRLNNLEPIGRYSRFFLVFWGETDTIMKYHKNPVKLGKSSRNFLNLIIEGFPESGHLPPMCNDMNFKGDLKPHIFKVKEGQLTINPYTNKNGIEFYNMTFSKCLFRDFWGREIKIDLLKIKAQAHLHGTG
jgi:hypothetical protein